MKRVTLYLSLLSSVLMLFAIGTVAAESRPNIVFILADDWGWGDLGCYGNKQIRTPNLDRLAAEGTLFKQFYVASAVCSPSRASFMTGRFTNRHGIHSHLRLKACNLQRGLPAYLNPQQPMLPRLLKEAGYATAHFGKWHLTSPDEISAPLPTAYGIDDHRITVCNGDGIHRQPAGVPGWKEWEEARLGNGEIWTRWRAKASELIINEAIRFIDDSKGKPFFVQAWLFDTHAQLVPNRGQQRPFSQLPGPYRLYYSAAADSDQQVGRLMKALADRGLSTNTIVIFSSDNGPEDISVGNASEHGVGDPGPVRGRKRSGYEGGIRVPFIVRWPGGTPAGRVDAETVMGGVDLLPTLCQLAGVKVPEGLDGEDFSAAFRGQTIKRQRPLFWDLREDNIGPAINRSPKLVLRDGNWKLLMNRDGSGKELYDLAISSLEVNNQADRQPEVVGRMSRQLLKLAERKP
jgi:arylsulfatase A-like enzyme